MTEPKTEMTIEITSTHEAFGVNVNGEVIIDPSNPTARSPTQWIEEKDDKIRLRAAIITLLHVYACYDRERIQKAAGIILEQMKGKKH